MSQTAEANQLLPTAANIVPLAAGKSSTSRAGDKCMSAESPLPTAPKPAVELESDRSLDQRLVEKVQRGDKRAFDLLVTKYQHRLISLILRFVKDPDDAKDVAQETFIKAYRAIPRFRGDSAFYTWLYRIAINTAKNHLVSKGRRMADSQVDIADAEQFESAHLLKDVATPERHLMRDEIQNTVHKVLSELPEDLRMAVTLREFDGLSYEEIAAVMDCPIGTVRSRIFRGREAIDKCIIPLIEN